MSLQWNIIAGFLYLEIGLVILFLLPVISPRKWQKVFNYHLILRVSRYSAMYFYILLAVLFLFFLDAARDMKKYAGHGNSINFASEMKGSIRLFRAQRNFYITFFSIYLSFVLRRLITMIDIQATLINKSEAIIKEAEEAKNLACRTVQDHDNLVSLEKKTQEDTVNGLNEQIEQLAEKCETYEATHRILTQKYEEAINDLKLVKEKCAIDH